MNHEKNVCVKKEERDESYEDPLETEWARIHIKWEPHPKFDMDSSEPEHNDESPADSVDQYDVITISKGDDGEKNSQPSHTPDSAALSNAFGYIPNSNLPDQQMSKKIDPNAVRIQLYIGNLTWWTTDQEITDTILGLGVTDLIEVKFFENRSNGRSKGFCVVTLGSITSMMMCLEKLQMKDLHGRRLIVTFPSKTAIEQFEALGRMKMAAFLEHYGLREPVQQPHPPGIIHSPPEMRPMVPPPGMPPPNLGQQVPGPLIGYGGPQAHWHPQESLSKGHPPPGFQHSNWNGPQANGPGGPPSIYGGPPQAPPVPHMNHAFFQQGAGPPHQGSPQQGPPQHQGPPHFYGPPPAPQPQYGTLPPEFNPKRPPPIIEAEFQEVMKQNRTISSSAIARAVADAAAGEYASAIETLGKAISLIKQSKISNDARCEILISSLQDTIYGIEIKSYESARRERSRSRERERSLRSRRERSHSHDQAYRERSRGREREQEHDRSYTDAYPRDQSQSRDREREREYREQSHEERYYDYRYREREREHSHEGTRHEPEHKRGRDRERGRRDERESPHCSTRR